jgi:adenine-specific DNA-methyltransferase
MQKEADKLDLVSQEPAKSRVATLRRLVAQVKRANTSALSICRSLVEGRTSNKALAEFFAQLPSSDRHYWIASLYALLMPSGHRKRLSAYFTPPHLANHALQVLRDNGVVLGKDRILDPASGGAAFFSPTRLRDSGQPRVLRPQIGGDYLDYQSDDIGQRN